MSNLQLENIYLLFEVNVCTFQVIWGSCAVEEGSKSDRNIATEIKAPEGSIHQKYVYTSFIVKTNFKFGFSGHFEFVWVKAKVKLGSCQVCMVKVMKGKKFKFLGVAAFWTSWHNVGNISESIYVWWRMLYWWNVVSILIRCCTSIFCSFSFSKLCTWFSCGVKVWVQI